MAQGEASSPKENSSNMKYRYLISFSGHFWHAWIQIHIWIPNPDLLTLLTEGKIDWKRTRLFLAVVGFGSKGKISAALIFKHPPPLLRYTYVTDAILLSFLWGWGLALCRGNLHRYGFHAIFSLGPNSS